MPDSGAGLYQLEVARHPAARAWAQISLSVSNVRDVVPVERCHESAVNLRRSLVYRLEGVGESGGAVIAKKCQRQDAQIERTIYEQVLPNLPVPTPRFFGMASDEDGMSFWLFTEDAGNEAYSPLNPMHRTMAGRWLGALHASTISMPPEVPLPDRGPVQYLQHLRSARDAIRENLSNPALDLDQRRELQRIVAECDLVEREWERVEQFCREMPETLVHGDFVGKNVRVRSGSTGIEILPFDWEHAGRGVPAVDLAQAAFPSTTFLANPDLEAYWATAQWPGRGFGDLRLLAVYGTVFRCLAALDWESFWLACEWAEWPVKNMVLYEAELAKAVQAAGWRN